MKLNYKRTIFVGMAFFLIMAFWQAYDAIIPLMLNNHFGLSHVASGAIMSLDNILAVFMLPFFGALSDRSRSKYGKRTPFIFIGTIVSTVTFFLLTYIDNLQLAKIVAAGIPDIPQGAMTETAYNEHLQKLALEITLDSPLLLVGFIATLLVVLVAMSLFRSPAVALMPDVTVKPLRSKANAVINLTGTAGAIIVLLTGKLMKTSSDSYMQYTGYVLAVCLVMLTGFIVFLLSVKEKKWAKEMEESSRLLGLDTAPSEEVTENKGKLTKPELRSLLFILASVALWYIGYNSITTKYSTYAMNVLGFDYNLTLIVAQAAAIVSYIPIGMLATKIGRKKSILLGIIILAASFFVGIFVTPETPEVIMYPIFALAGIGWATINVNSFPMAVELAKSGDVGKYTGYYYTASMAAQVIAPIFSGLLYDIFGMKYVFFGFGCFFVVFSFVTMLFVKHGDSEKIEKKSALEHLDVD